MAPRSGGAGASRTLGDIITYMSDADPMIAWCAACERAVMDEEQIAVYECTRCSTTTDERRCPDCNIFTARADYSVGCPDCFGELDHDIEIVTDHDGSLILAADFDADGPSNAQRAATIAEQRKTAAAEQLATTTRLVDARDLVVGDVLHGPYSITQITEIWHPADDLIAVVAVGYDGRRQVHGYTGDHSVRIATSPDPDDYTPDGTNTATYGVGSTYAHEVTVAPARIATTIPALVVLTRSHSTQYTAALLISRDEAFAVADHFDSMADMLTAAEAPVRPDVTSTPATDIHISYDDYLIGAEHWAHEPASSYNREGFINRRTGAFFDSAPLLTDTARLIRAAADTLATH